MEDGGRTQVLKRSPARSVRLEEAAAGTPNARPRVVKRFAGPGLLAPARDRARARRERDLLDELLHMISCKAAIKAGDRLSREEISALIERRGLVQDSHHCPHGRPTALVFTREELDRRFKRI